MPEEDLHGYHNKTRGGREITFTGSVLIWRTTKDTKLHKGLNSKGLSSRSSCPSSSNHVQNKRQLDRLVIRPARVLTCALLRLTKRTNTTCEDPVHDYTHLGT